MSHLNSMSDEQADLLCDELIRDVHKLADLQV